MAVNSAPMNLHPRHWRLGLAAALVMVTATAHATSYSEFESGDLSSNNAAPTSIGDLTLGDNYIIGATIPTGPVVDPMTGARANQDNDYMSFTIAPGKELSQLVIDSDTLIKGNDRMFMGIASGTGVYVPSDFSSASGLLGWTLVGEPLVGKDALPDLGLSHPAMFPAIPGATTFHGPLGAGTYTLWLLDGDRPVTYSLDLKVASVPEPASWATMIGGIGFLGGAMRRQRAVRSSVTFA